MPKIKDMMAAKYDKMTPENVFALIDKCSARSEFLLHVSFSNLYASSLSLRVSIIAYSFV